MIIYGLYSLRYVLVSFSMNNYRSTHMHHLPRWKILLLHQSGDSMRNSDSLIAKSGHGPLLMSGSYTIMTQDESAIWKQKYQKLEYITPSFHTHQLVFLFDCFSAHRGRPHLPKICRNQWYLLPRNIRTPCEPAVELLMAGGRLFGSSWKGAQPCIDSWCSKWSFPQNKISPKCINYY